MINWEVRLKNPEFWKAIIPATALAIQAIAAVFGWTIDLSTLAGKLIAVVDSVFAVLVILGIVVDPTTKGVTDSVRALAYEKPWDDSTGGAKTTTEGNGQ